MLKPCYLNITHLPTACVTLFHIHRFRFIKFSIKWTHLTDKFIRDVTKHGLAARSEFRSCLCRFPALWFWVSYLASQCFNFLSVLWWPNGSDPVVVLWSPFRQTDENFCLAAHSKCSVNGSCDCMIIIPSIKKMAPIPWTSRSHRVYQWWHRLWETLRFSTELIFVWTSKVTEATGCFREEDCPVSRTRG